LHVKVQSIHTTSPFS